MRIKYLITILFGGLAFSQNNTGNLEKFIALPSPTAFQFTKYGDVPVNESSGRISKNIPLYEYKAGNLSLPINMVYMGNGVKVEQLPTWTGVNWSIEAGGVITRIVNDLPDESSTYRILYDWNDLNQLNLGFDQQNIMHMQSIASNDSYDSQVDLFSFSFLGYSGSFYLDDNLNPVLVNKDSELKIEKLNWTNDFYQDNQTIIITTPDGIKFYFGSDTASEQTRIDFMSTLSPTTAYYLNKIVHPFGDYIFLEYDTINVEHNIFLSQYQSQSRVYNISGFTGTPEDLTCGSENTAQYSSGTTRNIVYNGRYLKRIYSNRTNEEIHFYSTQITNNQNYNRILEKINIDFNSDENLNRNIIFRYDYPNTKFDSDRFFLEKISFTNDLFEDKFNYEFEYNDPFSLPSRTSFSQDFLGYFNGKNNSTLLPKDQSENYFTTDDYADREPDFEFSTKGVLKKIIYPTGGFTEIEYEAPNKMIPKRFFLNVFNNQPNITPNTDLLDLVSLSRLDANGEAHGIYKDQTIILKINVQASGNVNHHYKVKAKIINVNNSNDVQNYSFFLETNIFSYYEEFSFNVVKDKHYRVELELENDPNGTSLAPVNVSAYLDYLNGDEFREWLGIRVKRTLDYDSANSEPIIKRYYYKKISNYLNPIEEGEIVFVPNFLSYSKVVACCDSPTDNNLQSFLKVSRDYSFITLHTSFLNNYFPSSDSQNLYKNVSISYGGDDFENGGIEKSFLISFNGGHTSYPVPGDNSILVSHLNKSHKSNLGILDGVMVKESSFTKKDGTIYLNAEKQYNYETSIINSIPNLYIVKLFNECLSAGQNHSIDNLYLGTYSTFAYKKNLKSETSTEYIDIVPVSDIVNSSNYKKIINSVEYQYDGYVGLPTKILKSTSESNKKTEIRNYYSNQVNNLSGFTSDQINAIDVMQNVQHRFNNLIQTESYEKINDVSELLSKERTIFKNWNNGGLILPEKILVAKGNNDFQTYINFHGYSIYGDLLELSNDSGMKIRYVYDLESKIIRKIENYIHNGTSEPAFGFNNITNPCFHQNQYPSSFVTLYNYLNGTRLIERIEDYNCNPTYYYYDGLGFLQFVKDKDNNILSESKYHYKN